MKTYYAASNNTSKNSAYIVFQINQLDVHNY